MRVEKAEKVNEITKGEQAAFRDIVN